MSGAEVAELPAPEEDAAPAEESRVLDRDRDLLGRRSKNAEAPKSGIRKRLDEIFDAVARGFEDQSNRSDAIQDYWDCYNCRANQHRYYSGIADIYFPIIRDAVEARVTRFSNQLFPQGGRYIQAAASDGSGEEALVAILDHYIRRAKMKTMVVAPLQRNGDIEGQYNLYVDWAELERQIVSRETHGPIDPQTGAEMPGEEILDIRQEDVVEGFPVFEVLHDPDVLVLPPTADSVEEALAAGGCAAIVRRWSKEKIDRLAESGQIRKDEAKELKAAMGSPRPESRDTGGRILEHVGIRKSGKEAVVWEVWTMLPLDKKGDYAEDGRPRLCRVFFGPQRSQLGAKRNPYWNDRCPLLSWPQIKMTDAFKGPSAIAHVASLQYEANDAINEGADAATYAAAPIVLRDPAKSNGPLVFGMGAVWDGAKDAISLLTFPDLTPRAVARVQMALQAIFQSLGVNPSMLPQQTRASKPNQAMIAQEQAVDLLTTAAGVSVLEEGILTPAVEWAVDLDYQFRDRDLVVRMFGEEGRRAEMQAVAPLQNRNGLTFTWRGGEQVRQNAMMQQQGTGMLNVMMSPGVQQALAADGKKFTPAKIIEQMVMNAFGPDLAQSSIVDQRRELTNPPDMENEWMQDNLPANVHPLDDDNVHMREHFQDIQARGDPSGLKRPHMMAHQQQQQMKIQAQMMQQMQLRQQGAGANGSERSRPPGPGQPQPGAAPAGPRLIKGPAGQIHPDQAAAAGGMQMPRRF